MNKDGSGFAVIHNFPNTSSTDGTFTDGALSESDGRIFGQTLFGGTNNLGTIFSFNLTGGAYQKVYDFLPSLTGQPRYGMTHTVIEGTSPLPPAVVNLGPDELLCTKPSVTLTAVADSTQYTFTWQDGSHNATYHVRDFGTYWVKVSNTCSTGGDTIKFTSIPPPTVNLGSDKLLCTKPSATLIPVTDSTQYTFTWQDGSHTAAYHVKDFGTYWVNVFNGCVTVSDTIKFTTPKIPVVNFGIDELLCFKPSVTLKPVTDSVNYTFTWQDGTHQASYHVQDFGIYSVSVGNGCVTVSDTISFINESLPVINLGKDAFVCSKPSVILAVTADSLNYKFTWQDGSTHPTFHVTDFGTYSLTISSICGHAKDSVTFHDGSLKGDVPNVITRNDDGYNDYFKLAEGPAGPHLLIVNRWGHEVYSNSDYQNTWNGNGLSAGVYFLEITSKCGDKYKGTVTILE
jgi:uncharacterized repeat protein (TIGR03803 family)